ncbi:orotate phosphoribosyltransferase [Sporocytophaga myxococcoides]|uniref:Orotate phosphoribosyltransferase n=1 Tax=Sporocytophaga myxococcoides TaxID=153721 RepID=A0A098LA52_9BACT|nr:orotate phosphoribosyltransferase [Sporocytophaga myxococcoides]GAL83287.1 orotate phosphoribosyltransferase [Sporocytophaga myxococcoides]
MSSEKVAESLLKIGAIKLRPENPFKWASGWNSPIYCDNRFSLSFPDVRNIIKEELVSLVKEYFPQTEAIAGVATAGIPQGTLIADKMNLPFLYVRPKPKDHGMENLIEGKIHPGQKVVVVEDLISTGGSSLKAVEALRDGGIEVLGMVSIFTYSFDIAEKNFKDKGVILKSLTDYNALLKEAIKLGYIKESDLETLSSWRTAPEKWSV